MKLKICSVCKKEFPISEFYKNKGKPDGLRYQCKKCTCQYMRTRYQYGKYKSIKWSELTEEQKERQREAVRKYRKTTKGKENNKKHKELFKQRNPNYHKRWRLNKDFGISIEEYEKMFIKQNGCCAICNKPQSRFKLHFAVDHCHTTKKVRGLLCVSCNLKLGWFEQYNVNVIDYLKG